MSRHVAQHKSIIHRVEYLHKLWPKKNLNWFLVIPTPSRLCLDGAAECCDEQQSSLFCFVGPFVILHWIVWRRTSVFSSDLCHHIKSCAFAQRGSLCVNVFVPDAPLSTAVTIPQPVRPQMPVGGFYGHAWFCRGSEPKSVQKNKTHKGSLLQTADTHRHNELHLFFLYFVLWKRGSLGDFVFAVLFILLASGRPGRF